MGRHDRSRGRARRRGDTWVSRCRRCDVRLERTDKGRWVEYYEEPFFLPGEVAEPLVAVAAIEPVALEPAPIEEPAPLDAEILTDEAALSDADAFAEIEPVERKRRFSFLRRSKTARAPKPPRRPKAVKAAKAPKPPKPAKVRKPKPPRPVRPVAPVVAPQASPQPIGAPAYQPPPSVFYRTMRWLWTGRY